MAAPDAATRRHQPRHRRPVPADAAVAPEHLPGAPADARRTPGRLRAARPHALQRRVRAERMGAGLVRAGAAQSLLLERRRHAARCGEVPADPGRERRADALPRRRAAGDLRGAARPVRLDQGPPRRRAAHRSAADDLLLRLQPATRAVQGRREAAPRAVAGHRPREARHARTARRRAARLRLGAARGRSLRVAVLRLPGRAHAAAHRRGAAAVPRGRLLEAAPARLRAALQRRRGAHQARARHRLDVEGGARCRGAPDAGGVQVTAAGHRPGRRRDVPLQLGGRLQRRLYVRAVPEERLRREPAPLSRARATTRCSRRPSISPIRTRAPGCWRKPSARPLPTTR